METTEAITYTTYLLFVYLTMALFVERATEIFVSIFNFVDFKAGWYRIWNRKAGRYREKFDPLYDRLADKNGQKAKFLTHMLWRVVTDKPYVGGRFIIAASVIRLNYVRSLARIFAFLMALMFAYTGYYQLDIDLCTLAGRIINDSELMSLPVIAKILITATALSIGTEPLHQAITRLERIGKSREGKNG